MQTALIYYGTSVIYINSCLYVFSFHIFSDISNTVSRYSHRCFCRGFQALSFDNKKGFNHRDNREEIFKILRWPFFLGHPLHLKIRSFIIMNTF